MPLRHLRLALSAALLLAGCSSSSTGPTTPASFAAAYAEARAARLAGCGDPETAASVRAAVGLYFDGDPARLAANPDITYDPVAGKAALDSLATITCAQLVEMGGPPYAFARAFRGKVAMGGSCASYAGYDCAGTAICQLDPTCLARGTCVAAAGVGEDCTATNCQVGTECDGLTCAAIGPAPLAAPGGSCLAAVCPAGQYCDGTSTCVGRTADGAACASDQECALASFCPAGTCLPVPRLGSACTPLDFTCPGGTWCSAAGRCVAAPMVGQPCGALGGEPALCQDAWCDTGGGTSGTCKATRPVGQACGALPGECGLHGDCVAGACAANYCMNGI